jgi:hypothetical protein
MFSNGQLSINDRVLLLPPDVSDIKTEDYKKQPEDCTELDKKSCQVVPNAIPKETMASLNRLTCHHVRVKDLNKFMTKG